MNIIKAKKRKFLKKGRPESLRLFFLDLENKRIARAPFYRLFPYHGHMGIRDVDLRSVVDQDLKIFYHRIPKAGNSSLVSSVTQLKCDQKLQTDIRSKRSIKRDLLNPSVLNYSDAVDVENYFKFLVVRNPYHRVLSAYLSKVVQKYENGKNIDVLMSQRDESKKSSLPDFKMFCEFLADGGLYANHHWVPQVDYLIYPPGRYDFIGRLETIDRDFQIIADRITGGKDHSKKMMEEDEVHKTGASDKVESFYDQYLYDLVYQVYKEDFDVFGYKKR